MAPRTLPGLGLSGFWALGEDGWNTGADQNWLKISVLVQLSVISRTTALPGSPSNGDIYIVPADAISEPNKVAVRDNGAWVYMTPQEGWRGWVRDTDELVTFNGTAWVVSGGSGGLADDSVTNPKLSNMDEGRIKGRFSSGTGDPEDLTAAQVKSILAIVAGDISNFNESVDDRVAALLSAGSNISISYDDVTNTLVISSTGGGGGGGGITDAPSNGKTYGRKNAAWVEITESLIIAVSDETTALTAGTAKVTFRMPYAFTLTAVRASLTTEQASGSIFTVDINENGSSILSTKLTIDNTEKTSTTAATAPVISDTSLADDAEITIDIDQIGNGSAAGLKVVLIGTRT